MRIAAGQHEHCHPERRAIRASPAPTGTVWPAASRADCPDPRNRTSSSAAATADPSRYDHKTGEAREDRCVPAGDRWTRARDLKCRFQWTAPILLSPQTRHAYHAAQTLLRSRDGGQSWEEISPNLTRNDKTKQDYSGGPIAHEFTGVETYDDFLRGRISARGRHHLGGHRRRACSAHAQRGQDVDQRHAEGYSRVDPDQRHRGVRTTRRPPTWRR